MPGDCGSVAGWATNLSVAQGKLFVAGNGTVTAYAPTS
jgi:hypothetical protein